MNRISFSKSQFANAAAKYIARQFDDLLKNKDRINVALSGGTSPIPVYENLKEFSIDWERICFYLVDERVVPLLDAQNNFHNISKSFFVHIPSKSYCIHDGTKGAAISAMEFEKTLLKNLPKSKGQIQFDFILLGMGLDGHTASLFPDNEALNEKTKPVAYTYVSQIGNHRISLTLPVINNALKRILLIDSKKEIILKSNACRTLPIGLVEQENMDILINELHEN